MSASIALFENTKNNWTATVSGTNKDGKSLFAKKAKAKGSSNEAIETVVKVLNLGEWSISKMESLESQAEKNTAIAKLANKLKQGSKIHIECADHLAISINFMDANSIDLNKKTQAFIGEVFSESNVLKIKLVQIDAVLTDDLMNFKERVTTEIVFDLINENLFDEIANSKVSAFATAAERCNELMIIRLKAK